MGSKRTSVERLRELLKDHSVEDLEGVFALLQENHEGDVREFTEAQIQQMNAAVPFKDLRFSQEAVSDVVEQLKQTRSTMSRLGRTQVSRFVLSLTRDEIVEVVDLMLPFFVSRSGKFVETLTADQQIATFKTLFPEILKSAHAEGRVAELLLGLYSVSRVGESLEILSGDALNT